MTNQKKTNAVKFGQYGIVLEKEQLGYYLNGELFQVRDVNHEFNSDDLYNLALRIATKADITAVHYVTKSDIVGK